MNPEPAGARKTAIVFADSHAAEDDPGVFLAAARDAMARHGGEEVKSRGAWLMVVFPAGAEAVRALLEAQEALVARGAPPLRAGVNLGEPIRVQAGKETDYFGPGVNRAARLLAAGHPGQVLVSEAVRAGAEDVPVGEWRELGEHRLRGIEKPERIWLALPAALRGREFPPLEAPSARSTNLPQGTSAFVGREAELAALAERLRPGGARLLTLTGTGGVGKSRLAVRAAAAAIDRFPGGVWFADLTATSDAPGIAGAVARALDLALPGAANPAAAVADALALRRPLLLLLDNFEHVLPHAAATAGLWLTRAPAVTLLATSRAPVGVAGEEVVEVAPLPAPAAGKRCQDPRELLRYDAARLFVDRVSAVRRGFELTPENAGEIGELCARLDGLPLAVELAAARAAVLRPAEILARLDRKFDLLRSSQRDLTPRQRTLIGAIEWSFDLLSAEERSAFLQACVFRGGFDPEGAEGVIELPGGEAAVRLAVRGLREQSLLRSEGPRRYAMYVAIHEYAWQRWRWTADEAGQRALELRHAAYFARRSEVLWRRARREGSGEPWEELDVEADNLRAAHDAAVARGEGELAARLALGLDDRLNRRGPTDERLRRLEASLAALGDRNPALRALLLGLTISARMQAGLMDDAALRLPDEAVALARTAGDEEALAFTLLRRADILTGANRPAEVLRDIDESEALYRRAGDDAGTAAAINVRGIALRVQGRLADAEAAYGAAESIYRRLGNLPGVVHCLSHRVQLLLDRGRYEEALGLCGEAGTLATAAGTLRIAANLKTMEAATLADSGRPAEALAVLAAAEDLIRSVGDRRLFARSLDRRGECLTALGDARAAIPLLEEAITLRRETGDVRGSAISLARRGEAYSTIGDHRAALADLEAAAGMFEAAGDPFSHGTALLHAAIAERRAGRPVDAMKKLSRAEELLNVEGGNVNRPELCGERARCLAALGRGGEALASADEAVSAAQSLGLSGSRRMMYLQAILALAAASAGDPARATGARAEALALARAAGETPGAFPDDLREALGE